MSTGRTTLNDDFRRMWNEVIMAYFKETFSEFVWGDWENFGKPGSIAVSNWEEFSTFNYFPFCRLNYMFLLAFLSNPSASSSDIQRFFLMRFVEIFWHVMLSRSDSHSSLLLIIHYSFYDCHAAALHYALPSSYFHSYCPIYLFCLTCLRSSFICIS